MKHQPIKGHVHPGFDAVVSTFAENFDCRGELGGACAAYHRGEKVVDIWGGVRNKADRRAVARGHDGDRVFGD